jgi:hypothetical protein
LAQCLFEFEPAATDVGGRSLDTNLSPVIDQATGFGNGLIIDENFAGNNFTPAFFAAGNQPTLYQ